MRKVWKQRIKAYRTHGFLKAKAELSAQSRETLNAMTNAELVAAALNEDHSDIGRKAAEEVLKRKGGALSDADIVVPGFVKPDTPEGLRRRFFGISRTIRKYTGMFGLSFFVAMFVAIIIAVEAEDPSLEQAVEAGLITQEQLIWSDRDLTEAEKQELEAAVGPDIHRQSLRDLLLVRAEPTEAGQRRKLAETIGMTLIGFMMFCFLLYFPMSIFRRNPARVLLLRKFNNKKISKAMGNLIMTELKPFGHVVTLSDKFLKRSRFAWLRELIPTNFFHAAIIIVWYPLRIILRQFNRSKYGPAYVGSARDFRNLAKRLRDRIGLNLEITMSSKEAFIVRTNDNWWQNVVATVMNSSDVIVVDLSHVTSGTQWELERLERLGLFDRAVFTAFDTRATEARIAMLKIESIQGRPLFVYDKVGDMVDQTNFRTAVLEAMSVTLADKQVKADTQAKLVSI